MSSTKKKPSTTRKLVNAAAIGTAAGLLTRSPVVGVGAAGLTYVTGFAPIPIGGSKTSKTMSAKKVFQMKTYRKHK